MARRPIQFSRHDDSKKLNPNSLRKLILDVVNSKYGSTRTQASRELSKYVSRYNKKHLTTKALDAILDDKAHIYYWHLEAISRSLGIPTGVFLLYSRMRSNIESGNKEENSKIVAGLQRIIEIFDTERDLVDKIRH